MSVLSRLKLAWRAGAVHFSISVVVASLTALLVFYVWYPWPLSELQGGRELYWLVVWVDVICGPLLTLVLWNPAKPRRELTQDMALVAVLQLAALGYGLSTVAQVRPVIVAFEVDRFRVVSASEIDNSQLTQAMEPYQKFPWTGPYLVSVRDPRNNEELIRSINESIAGRDPALRPGWWQPFELKLEHLLQRARPIDDLVAAKPAEKDAILQAVEKAGVPASELRWLPLTSTKSMDWVVLIDRHTGRPRAYLATDGFF